MVHGRGFHENVVSYQVRQGLAMNETVFEKTLFIYKNTIVNNFLLLLISKMLLTDIPLRSI